MVAKVNPHWQNGFDHDVHYDAVTNRWWFRLELVSETAPAFSFESEVVYTTRDDAEQAAQDAATAAASYQAHCVSTDPGPASR